MFGNKKNHQVDINKRCSLSLLLRNNNENITDNINNLRPKSQVQNRKNRIRTNLLRNNTSNQSSDSGMTNAKKMLSFMKSTYINGRKLINPCNSSFKYCIDDEMRESQFCPQKYLIEPCKIKPMRIHQKHIHKQFKQYPYCSKQSLWHNIKAKINHNTEHIRNQSYQNYPKTSFSITRKYQHKRSKSDMIEPWQIQKIDNFN